MANPAAKPRPTALPRSACAYSNDLAYVHDAGFTAFAKMAGRELLRIFDRHAIRAGQIVDIGCGTGVLAEIFVAAGYRVLGIDISPSMLKLARRRAPTATFRKGSLLDVPLPRCDAITCTGEILNYLFDSSNSLARLKTFFARACHALRPGGLLIFDFLAPLGAGTRAKAVFRTGRDWAVLVHVIEDRSRHKLAREIATFRRVGARYRRSEEVHALKLYPRDRVAALLRRVGFIVRVQRGYGAAPLAPGHFVVLARRP